MPNRPTIKDPLDIKIVIEQKVIVVQSGAKIKDLTENLK